MIRGYAALFNVFSQPGNRPEPLIVRPGAFDLFGRSIYLHYNHRGADYAGTRERTLRLWQDDIGLAFEADVPGTNAGLSLACAIAAGQMDQVSAGYGSDRESTMERVDGEWTEIITATNIVEISITDEGGCPGTACWMSSADVDDLPDHVRKLTAKWSVGRQAAILARAGRQALSQPRPSAAQQPSAPTRRSAVPDSLTALLRDPVFQGGASLHAGVRRNFSPATS